MARITAGVGSSHVPLLGVAVDQGKTGDDYFGPIFAGYDWTREWEKAEQTDVVILVYNEHASADAALHIVLGLAFEDDAVDPLGAQQVAKQQSRRPGADNRDPRFQASCFSSSPSTR